MARQRRRCPLVVMPFRASVPVEKSADFELLCSEPDEAIVSKNHKIGN